MTNIKEPCFRWETNLAGESEEVLKQVGRALDSLCSKVLTVLIDHRLPLTLPPAEFYVNLVQGRFISGVVPYKEGYVSYLLLYAMRCEIERLGYSGLAGAFEQKLTVSPSRTHLKP